MTIFRVHLKIQMYNNLLIFTLDENRVNLPFHSLNLISQSPN